MHVHAHPDDESSKGAASTMRYRAEGVEVLVVSCTGGELGSILNPALADDPLILEDIIAVRRAEMARAAQILDVQHVWLGFHDSGFPEADEAGVMPPLPPGCFALEPLAVTGEALVRLVRSFKPHVMTTYDEKGGYPHPDHVMTHVVAVEAFGAAGDPARYPGAGEPWQPSKLYYQIGFHKARLVALDEVMEKNGIESPYKEWLKTWEDKPEDGGRVTTRVECGEFFARRDQALLAHATQIDPLGRWFTCPIELQVQAWPTEDFQLALSHVPTTIEPGERLYDLTQVETDLFEGVREAVAAGTLEA